MGHKARVYVLDNFSGEEERLELLQQITAPGFYVSAHPQTPSWNGVSSERPAGPASDARARVRRAARRVRHAVASRAGDKNSSHTSLSRLKLWGGFDL